MATLTSTSDVKTQENAQNVRMQIVQELLSSGKYETNETDYLINNAHEIAKFVLSGELYQCDSCDDDVACDGIPDMVDDVPIYAPKTDPMATYIPSNACTPLSQLGDYCSIEIEPCDKTVKKLQILKKHNTLSFYPDAYVRFRKLTREQALGTDIYRGDS